MSLSFLLRFGQKRVFALLPEFRAPLSEQCKNFHAICQNNWKTAERLLDKAQPSLTDEVRGMKTKGKLNLRCKDCYFVTRQGRRYVMCKTHGRHKQQQTIKKERNTWILTHATQHKIRPW